MTDSFKLFQITDVLRRWFFGTSVRPACGQNCGQNINPATRTQVPKSSLSRALVLSLILIPAMSPALPLITGKSTASKPSNPSAINTRQSNVADANITGKNTTPTNGPWIVDWNLAISGGDSKWATRSSTRGEFSANLRASYRPSSLIQLDLQPLLRFDTGAKSAYTTDESLNSNYEQIEAKKAEPANLRLLQASATAFAYDYATAELGILKQDHFLTDRLGWLGGRGKAGYLTGPYQGFIYSEQMIVSTMNYSSQIQEIEKTPSLHRAGVEGQISIPHLAEARIGWGKFSFVEIPDTMATESAFRGNFVESMSLGHYRFQSAFEGTEIFARLSFFAIPSVRLFLDGDHITNESAKDDHGHGWRTKSGVEFGVTNNIQTSIEYNLVMIEPDARIGSLSSLGTNLTGAGFANYWHFRKEKLRVGLVTFESEPVYKMPLQEENHSIWLTVETDYARIF